MPFPLNALHHDLCRRLCDLATPGEAYSLQIAAPHFNGLNPLQKVKHCQNAFVNVGIRNKLISNLELVDDYIYRNDKYFNINYFKFNHNAQMIFDRFSVKTDSINFTRCQLTAKFLHDIAAGTETGIQYLSFGWCRFHKDVSPKIFVQTFKKLKCLTIHGGFPLTNNWIDAFITTGVSNLKRIAFFNIPVDILDIDKTRLDEFLRAQDKQFNMVISLSSGSDETKVMKALDSLFKQEEPNSGRLVSVYWKSFVRYYEPRKDSTSSGETTEFGHRPAKIRKLK